MCLYMPDGIKVHEVESVGGRPELAGLGRGR